MAIIWSGRAGGDVDAHLKMLHVTCTYAGLLWGHPDAELNRRRLAQAVEAAESLIPSWPVYLVKPQLVKRESEPRLGANGGEHWYEELPAFRCIGDFVSFDARDPENDASSLTIVWFQHRSPVEGIDLDLGELDWFTHARDFCY